MFIYLYKIEDQEIWFGVTDVIVGNSFLKKNFLFKSQGLQTSRGWRRLFFTVPNYTFHYWFLLKEPQIKCQQQSRLD